MKTNMYIILFTACLLFLTGCLDYSVNFYESGIVDDNPQHRMLTFEELEGDMKEKLFIEEGKGLNMRIEVTKGSLQVELINPDGENILKDQLNQVFNKENYLQLTSEELYKEGEYIIVLQGNKADGNIEIKF
ncbi:hypothetical protein PRVXT_002102 [Proteinivorax tanatarense]|uniref:Lipoprotein n=1 Tax=Proteinivorax tanatarense TaxID=1260629 RepID=A0AAU7VJ75_9FIRM